MPTRLLLALVPVLVVSCGETDEPSPSEGKKTSDAARSSSTLRASKPPAASDAPPASAPSPSFATLPAEEQPAALANEIYRLPDEDLDLVIETIARQEDPALRRTLLITVYEETSIRPALTRLPLLVELARQPDLEPSLRQTIVAELGATLNAEHGTSWSDWALAVEEHLAESEGLLRVE